MDTPLSYQIFQKFLKLATDLSPENLSCDGELPFREVQKRFNALRRKWKMLEDIVGRKVTEEEIWLRHMDCSKTASKASVI
jgi:hypothetical protein